jgi:hypothetical protein
VSDLSKRIKSAGYWETVVRPKVFNPRRIQPITALLPFLERCRVSARGWDFPHIDRQEPIRTDIDFIQQETEWQHIAEIWRFYQSGHFVHLRGMVNDWRDRSQYWPPDAGWKSGDRLGIGDTLLTMYEIFEFAARFGNALEGDDPLIIEITVGGLRNRWLYVDEAGRWPLRDRPVAQIDKFPQRFELPRPEILAAKPASRAISAAQELFRRFGREIPNGSLQDMLEKAAR